MSESSISRVAESHQRRRWKFLALQVAPQGLTSIGSLAPSRVLGLFWGRFGRWEQRGPLRGVACRNGQVGPGLSVTALWLTGCTAHVHPPCAAEPFSGLPAAPRAWRATIVTGAHQGRRSVRILAIKPLPTTHNRSPTTINPNQPQPQPQPQPPSPRPPAQACRWPLGPLGPQRQQPPAAAQTSAKPWSKRTVCRVDESNHAGSTKSGSEAH
jgi:hypothetical protein